MNYTTMYSLFSALFTYRVVGYYIEILLKRESFIKISWIFEVVFVFIVIWKLYKMKFQVAIINFILRKEKIN